MNTTLRWSLVVILAVGVGLVLLLSGMALGRFGWGMAGFGPASMMGGYGPNVYGQSGTGSAPYGYGMMGPGMPGYTFGQVYTGTVPYGMMGGGFGPGMMGMMDSNMMGSNMMGMMGGGMMGDFGFNSLYGVEPLSLADAQAAVEDYLAGLEDDGLALGEVMVFNNHAYAQLIERSTGLGAFEVLVDPVTLAIASEPGPNMMWNAKYGPMSGFGGFGMMGGMMGGSMMGGTSEISAEMPVSPEKAVETAQRYLDVYLPGAEAEDEVDTFYGYYTIHILRDGQTVGMLSINGYTRQVFVHTWHGDFVDMAENTKS